MATAILLPFVCQTCGREDHRQVNPGACDDCGARMNMAQVEVSTCHLIEDPGHGWLVVTPARLASYGISESMISPYSYRDRDCGQIALEEDCDAGVFIEAFKRVHEEYPHFTREHQDPCPIRSWASYGKKPSNW